MGNKIDPGPGYRLLEVGEVVPEGAECITGAYRWTPSGDCGRKHLGEIPRRIKLPEESKPTTECEGSEYLRKELAVFGYTESEIQEFVRHVDAEVARGTGRIVAEALVFKGAMYNRAQHTADKDKNTHDPRTKYLRKAYPVDGQVHTDDNGHQYILIDVYAVLQAFAVASHALGHAIKKLLCAGIRGKGNKMQDLTEAKVAIDRGIQEAGRE